jgi:hypothetical protein
MPSADQKEKDSKKPKEEKKKKEEKSEKEEVKEGFFSSVNKKKQAAARERLVKHKAAMAGGGKSPYYGKIKDGKTDKGTEGTGKDPWATHPDEQKAFAEDMKDLGKKAAESVKEEVQLDEKWTDIFTGDSDAKRARRGYGGGSGKRDGGYDPNTGTTAVGRTSDGTRSTGRVIAPKGGRPGTMVPGNPNSWRGMPTDNINSQAAVRRYNQVRADNAATATRARQGTGGGGQDYGYDRNTGTSQTTNQNTGRTDNRVFARKGGKPGFLNKTTGDWQAADASHRATQQASRRHDQISRANASSPSSSGSARPSSNATAADIARSDAQYRSSGGRTGVGRRSSSSSSPSSTTRPSSSSTGSSSTTRPSTGSTGSSSTTRPSTGSTGSSSTTRPSSSSTSTTKKDPMATWAKANPKLAAAKAERDRTRGTSSTTNPLMKDMKSRMPSAKPATTSSTGSSPAKKATTNVNSALKSASSNISKATPSVSNSIKTPTTSTNVSNSPTPKASGIKSSRLSSALSDTNSMKVKTEETNKGRKKLDLSEHKRADK